MNDWNPNLYMKFRSERTQPSIDLVAKMNAVDPKSILDIGCGPGNSTQVLVNRWPNAAITGLDSSSAMIKKAKDDYPNQEWIEGDVFSCDTETTYDIVFSNAVIQWIPDHKNLLKKMQEMLSENGLLGIQIPLFWDMSLGTIINDTANDNRWKKHMAGVEDLFTIHNHGFYYDVLSDLFDDIDMWTTNYIHTLDNHDAMVEMIRSTGMKPYLDRLDHERDKKEFENNVMSGIQKAYPKQKNGNVLLPFKRLFFTGHKSVLI